MMEWPARISRQFSYFHSGVLAFREPCLLKQLNALEQELDIAFTPSLLLFLQKTDGLGLMDMKILGRAEIQEQTSWHRERSVHQRGVYGERLEPAERQPEKEIVVGRDSSGDTFVLLNGLQPEGSEAPVAKFDHETGTIMWVVGSNFEHFLWFLLDDQKRKQKADGSEKSGYWRSRRWPSADFEWMLRHDPDLNLYRKPD